MNLDRLFHPRSVAVVGATERGGTYGSETLLNLARVGYSGEAWGVNPRRDTVHGVPCFPSLADLPSAPDAVVVAIPAAGVPDVIEPAGAAGAGGAVVYAAGFRESAGGEQLEAQLRAAAARHGLPVCGPNCDGLVALNQRVALWGDALATPEAGHVGLVSQSGNLAVNALATRRGLRLHTAISSGNEAVLGAADYLEHLAGEPELRSVALLLEDDGDGAHLCEALARCADANIGVAVLKVGSSAVGATAAAAHTGAVAGDQRVFRALMEEAGAAWADDLHDLLELAKALAVRTRRPRGGGLAILTCSGGDSGLGADEAQRLDVALPALGEATVAGLRERLPAAATVANPLDYTAMIWGEAETLRDIVSLVGEDPAINHVLVFYDHPPGLQGHPAESWEAVQEGILVGARASPVPVLVASTLPELLDDSAAWRFAEAGVPAVAGLRTGLACAVALQREPADPERLREIAAACPAPASAEGGRWLAEHEAKHLLRDAGLPVVPGRVVAGVDDAAAALAELGAPVALKLSSPGLRHKTEAGALELELDSESAVRATWRRLAEFNGAGEVLVEQMVPPG
ncbi:MAG: CoA-binding protein, partial [Solirubrobacteraceae bacterium]